MALDLGDTLGKGVVGDAATIKHVPAGILSTCAYAHARARQCAHAVLAQSTHTLRVKSNLI